MAIWNLAGRNRPAVKIKSVSGGRKLLSSGGTKLFSDVQRADDIEVVIPAQAGEKHFDYMEPVQLVNPWVTAEGYAINGNGYIDFIIHADDIIKA